MSKMTSRINRHYDDVMYTEHGNNYYGYSDFFNYGYWNENTPDQKTACENLVEKLLSFLPAKTGTILDVACGKGATAHYLLKYYKPQDITGINISEKQLATCKAKIPEATFLLMDAAKLEFEDNCFDNIMCVEAVFHFHTREKFLQEAYRVLKPRGYLVLTDILLTEWGERYNPLRPDKDGVGDLHEYSWLYRHAGFQSVEVIDATKECWEGCYKNLARYSYERLLRGEIDTKIYRDIAVNIFRKLPTTQYYLLVAARKE
ncbi:MAG: methyltransferase domain-containing protein [Proteobacteria bacterium]|nr:methyltransferase domain-containing protein [Pseudomonadota bacterium]